MSAIPKRKLFQPLTLVAIAAAVGLPLASLVAAKLAQAPMDQGSARPALAVSTLPVEPAAGYALRRIFTGRVEANRTSNLGFERAGLLREVLVREGDSVKREQVLARLDRALLESKRRELAASLKDARANQALAEATLVRYLDSVDEGAVTRQALDEVREGANAARAGVDLALARIASVDLDITKSQLRAPFAGIVTRRLADEGRVLAAGTPVLELQERAIPEIRVGIAGVFANGLQPGETYELAWRGRPFPARLRAVLPLRNLGTRTLDALFTPLAPPAGLRSGELVELELSQWIEESGLWLPLSALTAGPRGLWQAYATEPLGKATPEGQIADHRIAARPLEVLYQDSDRVYVRGPLGKGDSVVRTGLQRVVPGQMVRVLTQGSDRLALGTE